MPSYKRNNNNNKQKNKALYIYGHKKRTLMKKKCFNCTIEVLGVLIFIVVYGINKS